MRRLTVGTFLTLDGVMQAPGGPDEDRDGGFPHGGWSFPYGDQDFSVAVTGWFEHEPEHVHLLVNYPPTIAVTRLVNSLKGVSSRRLRQEFPDLRRHYWRAKRLWSGSYFAGSVGGAPISVLRQYIELQDRPA